MYKEEVPKSNILLVNMIEQLIILLGVLITTINVLPPNLNWEEDVPHCYHQSLLVQEHPHQYLSRLSVVRG